MERTTRIYPRNNSKVAQLLQKDTGGFLVLAGYDAELGDYKYRFETADELEAWTMYMQQLDILVRKRIKERREKREVC